MITLAFFFLLRPGEYTDSSLESTPFILADTQVFIGDRHISPLTSSTVDIGNATFVSLTFTTQKNGVHGEVIGLGRSRDNTLCPVQALTCRIIHLRTNHAAPTTPLARAFYQGQWHSITPSMITSTIKLAVTMLGPSLGFLATDVSARCLRAAGANALLCANIDGDII